MRSLLAIALLLAGCRDAEEQAGSPPLPIGVWVVADVEQALARLRPHYAKMSPPDRANNERSLRASVVEFHADGRGDLRTYVPWTSPGAWVATGDEIWLRSIPYRGAKDLHETLFRVRGGRLYVVSLGEEIELKRRP